MMNFSFGKLKANCCSSAPVSREDRLLALFIIYVFGVFFGCMACSLFFHEQWLLVNPFRRLIGEASFLLALLFFSTSYLGIIFVPAIVASRGFLFSAFLSSAYAFTESSAFFTALICEAVPSLIAAPCFLLLADDCLNLSGNLLFLRIGSLSHIRRSAFLSHLALCVLFLVIDFLYCFYVIPLLG